MQTLPTHGGAFAILAQDVYLAFVHPQDERWFQAAAGPEARQEFQVRVRGVYAFRRGRVRRDGFEFHAGRWPAIAVPAVVRQEAVPHRPLRRRLQRRIQGGVYLETGVDVLAKAVEEVAAHPFGGIGRGQIDAALEHGRGDGRRHRGLVLGIGDGALRPHSPQDEVAPRQRPRRAVDRVAAFGLLQNAGQHGQLGDVQLGGGLAVIGVRGRLHPVGVLAERHDVHVQRQDLVLAERVLDVQRREHLLEFADEHLLAAEGDHLGELHGDGARAGAHVGRDQAHDVVGQRDEVYAEVPVEALVLGVDESAQEVLRHVLERDGNEPPAELGDQGAVRRVDAQGRLVAVMSVGFYGRNLRAEIDKN